MVKEMTKNLKAVKASLIISILILSVIAIFTPVSTVSAADRIKLFSFNSYIDIVYDPAPLNEDLQIEKSINIPLTIKYKTDIPERFLPLMPWQLKNIILYGSMIGPMQKIHIEVVDSPDWADIYISQPDNFANIPDETTEVEITTSLVISPYEDAPAKPASIVLQVETETIGRINGVTFKETVPFTPSFIPTVSLSTDKPIRTIGPHESVNFEITVRNNANKKIRVTPKIVGDYSDWTPTINPSFDDIEAGQERVFTYSIIAPFDFGWHNEIESFEIDFTAQIFPLREEAAVGGPYPFYLRVNNYGFSTPGFEVITLLAALFFVGIILRKKFSN